MQCHHRQHHPLRQAPHHGRLEESGRVLGINLQTQIPPAGSVPYGRLRATPYMRPRSDPRNVVNGDCSNGLRSASSSGSWPIAQTAERLDRIPADDHGTDRRRPRDQACEVRLRHQPLKAC